AKYFPKPLRVASEATTASLRIDGVIRTFRNCRHITHWPKQLQHVRASYFRAPAALPTPQCRYATRSVGRDLDEDWGRVLAEFVPRIALAKDKDAYQLEMLALTAKVTDTQAILWSAHPPLRPRAGDCQLPVTTRFIENRAVGDGILGSGRSGQVCG